MLRKIKKWVAEFSWFERALIIAMIGIGVYFFIVSDAEWWYRALDLIVSVCGVISVVLCAKGKISQYYWGIINVSGYVVLAYMSSFYGEMIENVLFYIPANIIGLIMWKKHMDKKNDTVETKRMSPWMFVWVSLLCVALTLCFGWLLSLIGNTAPFLDSATNVLSAAGSILMIARYREQWWLWIIINIISVVMWVIAGSPTMVAMWGLYLVNSVYGLIVWSKGAKNVQV